MKRRGRSVLFAAAFGGLFTVAFGGLFAAGRLAFFEPIRYSAANPTAGARDVVSVSPPAILHLATPTPLRAIYMSSWAAGTPSLRGDLIKIIEETEVNALVIDIKDSTGRIAFNTGDSFLDSVGSVDERIKDIRSLVDELHRKKIYLIGRVVVFQDPFLAARRPELAVKRRDGSLWRDHKGLSWLDPTSREVWGYTLAVARRAYQLGFDEINFDYIRFPSDGDLKDISYPLFDENKQSRVEVLENFFRHLYFGLADLDVPLSADIFGMTTIQTDDLGIGQVLEKIEPYFDYLAPMVYPSHYPPNFLGYKNPAAFPFEVINYSLTEAARRLAAAAADPKKLRPWLQDFHLGAVYTPEMIRRQKQAVYDAGLESWTLWSPSNLYTVAALERD